MEIDGARSRSGSVILRAVSGRLAAVLLAVLGACASSRAQDEGDLAQPVAGRRVRIVAANLTAGMATTYDDGAGMRILSGLHPDVALVQEMRFGSSSPADLRVFVDTAFGPEFQIVRGT